MGSWAAAYLRETWLSQCSLEILLEGDLEIGCTLEAGTADSVPLPRKERRLPEATQNHQESGSEPPWWPYPPEPSEGTGWAWGFRQALCSWGDLHGICP